MMYLYVCALKQHNLVNVFQYTTYQKNQQIIPEIFVKRRQEKHDSHVEFREEFILFKISIWEKFTLFM